MGNPFAIKCHLKLISLFKLSQNSLYFDETIDKMDKDIACGV
jgi:hypothetical protein